ncbi:hypothetical protein [Olivibacter jilunii]|uniref:hypothetical protein n=1 Tax=Olivibacter jilunii TaxID=985016 RepID=UPI003F16250D
MRKLLIFSLVIAQALWLACGSSTRITASWIDPAIKGKPQANKTVFISALTRNMEVRTKLENALALQAEQRNIKAIKSSEHLRPDFYQELPPREKLLKTLKQSGADAILTVSLIDKESETRYIRGNARYAPFPFYRWYGGFYSYYNYWYPIIYDPGYYVTDKKYFLETNLYDLETEKLLWSAQSQTVNPGSIDNFVKTYPTKLIEQMIKDGLISQ